MNPIHILRYLRLKNVDQEVATLENSLEVADWFYSGHLGELPANEQRVYDAYNYLRTAFNYARIEADCAYLSNVSTHIRVSCICDDFDNSKVSASKGHYVVEVVLPKPVKRELIKCIKEAVEEKRQADLDKNWPLPTEWEKPKKTKKGKK
jgi:hypothetical protein